MERNYQQKLSIKKGTKIYLNLRKSLDDEGILDRSYVYYFFLTSFELLMFGIFVAFVIISNSLWQTVLATIGMAFFTVRLGGIAHDAGHRAILKSGLLNDVVGYIVCIPIVFPFKVWKLKHNAHHANPNDEAKDPDLQVPISFSKEKFDRKDMLVRIIRKYQAYIFYFIGPLVSISMRVKSLGYYISNFKPRYAFELFYMITGLIIMFVLPFVFFPLSKAIVYCLLFIFVSGFYMLNIFAPNHKGMPQLKDSSKFSFFEKQVVTSRNVVGNFIYDYLYMGLNYQIEHHLFPNTPRYKLKRIVKYAKAECKKAGIPYTEMSAYESTKFILTQLHIASKEFDEMG
ncbi:acyl-CoA desaturase [Candidatus Dojkabacteria bacterium]|uniref:Acyl-CoA desaturase n=1 Tax=Candidatus Dojkabacteria bacterium TaxID=2099670 RepID=A0A955L3C8_9BACT|nr:acyl-CoA desaturase [Candidatus Dojkabacteria bacterium]